MDRPPYFPTEEGLVKRSIEILDQEIMPKFKYKKYPITRYGIHRKKHNKYYKMFIRIIDYLCDLRDDYSNDIEILVEDYLTSVCEYYKKFNRQPNLNNFSPSVNNKIHFDEWIIKFEKENCEEYWIRNGNKAHEIVDVEYLLFDHEPEFIEV